MIPLFVHDHYYYRDGGEVLSKGQFHHSLWQRYLDEFDGLTVVGRDGGIFDGARQGVNIASRKSVDFKLYPNTNTLMGILSTRQKIKTSMAGLIAAHDFVILRGMSELGILAFFEAKRQRKPIAFEVIGCSWDDMWNYGMIAAKLYAPYRYFMNKYMVKNSDAVIYVSQEFLQNRYPTNAPIQAAASNVQINAASFRDAYESNRPAPLKMGLIGTLNNNLKGVDVVLDACRLLKDRGVGGFEFHVLGPGDPNIAPLFLYDTAKKYGLEGMVFYDGLRESGAPVHEWLRGLDLYLQPSFQEGVPRATIEAMAQSRPAIGSNVGGIPELLDSDCIVTAGNAPALADKIEWMINHPDVRAHHAKRNHDVALRYTMEKLVPIRTAFWRQVKSMVSRNQQA